MYFPTIDPQTPSPKPILSNWPWAGSSTMPAQNNQTHSPPVLAEESKAKWVNGSAHPILEMKILDSRVHNKETSRRNITSDRSKQVRAFLPRNEAIDSNPSGWSPHSTAISSREGGTTPARAVGWIWIEVAPCSRGGRAVASWAEPIGVGSFPRWPRGGVDPVGHRSAGASARSRKRAWKEERSGSDSAGDGWSGERPKRSTRLARSTD
jgi:hypothetical protein